MPAAIAVKLDPQQVALMKFILEDVSPEGADNLIRAAVKGAREILPIRSPSRLMNWSAGPIRSTW
jgi:hypothetical protein